MALETDWMIESYSYINTHHLYKIFDWHWTQLLTDWTYWVDCEKDLGGQTVYIPDIESVSDLLDPSMPLGRYLDKTIFGIAVKLSIFYRTPV